MNVMVALLRGINVGGASVVTMAEVREVATNCGFGNVKSYVQSGNLVFTTTESDPALVAETLRVALAESTPVAPDVVVRTRAEMHDIVAANPFGDYDPEPKQMHVIFMPGDTVASTGDVDVESFVPEEAMAIGRELYLYLPDGMGRSKLAAVLNRKSKAVGTARNWRTVSKLVDMADTV